jgi:PAS domain S-box-containing protein
LVIAESGTPPGYKDGIGMNMHLKILILEDSPEDVDLIKRELERGGITFSSVVAKKKNEFENALSEFKPDIILSDHSLPQFNSIEALKLYKEYQKETNVSIPFILITGTVSEEFAVQSIKAGADDYILKDRLKRLPSSIQNALEKTRIENERMKFLADVIGNEALMKEAEQLAHFGSWQADLLTGKYQWSDETFRIYGYKPGEVEPDYERFISHLHPEDLPSFKKKRDHAVAHLNSYESEFRIIDKKGNLKHLASKVVIKRNKANQLTGFAGFNLDITERKKADIRLQKSEQEYKSLFDQNPDSVYSLDLQGNFTKVNNGLIKLTGLTSTQLLNQSFTPFIAASDVERVYNHFLLAVKGEPQHYEAKFVDGKGKIFVLDVTNMPIVVNNKIVGVHGVAKNITEKKELETLLDQVHRLALIGGWEVDLIEKKVSWTSLTRELHEVSPDFIPDLETGIRFFKEGENREAILKALNRAIETGYPWDLELEIITAKGNARWIRSIGKAEFKDGKCVRLFGSFQDIHKRKMAEETVKEAYQEKITILESIGDAFFAVDKEWTVTYWNNIAEIKMQMPRERIIGKNLWDVYADTVSLAFYTQYHKAMNENTAVHFAEYYGAMNMWLEVSAYPSPSGLSVYFRDITELRKHIKEIEDQNIKLREIAWVQSHQVRAPLARIMGLIQLINRYPDQAIDLPDALNHILTSVNELDDIVRKIVRKTEEIV